MTAPVNNIPLSRPRDEADAVQAEVRTSFDRILSRRVFRWGPELSALERELGDFFRCPNAIAVTSGGVAITIALLALGVGPGDEVVTVPNVDVSISAPVAHTGATIVWCDIDEDSFNMSPQSLERVITPRTRALVMVHLFGNPADVDALRRVADAHGIPIVEDASHGPGASSRWRRCGSLGQIGVLSLSSGKPLGAASGAGVIITRHPELAYRARTLANYGIHPSDLRTFRSGVAGARFRCVAHGFNACLDEWQSTVLRTKLRHLPEWISRRRKQAGIYLQSLAGIDAIRPQARLADSQPVLRQFAVRVVERDHLLERLVQLGITPGIGYSPPLHLQALYQHGSRPTSDCPNTELVAEQLLTLPLDPHLEDAEISFVADSLAELVQRRRRTTERRGRR